MDVQALPVLEFFLQESFMEDLCRPGSFCRDLRYVF